MSDRHVARLRRTWEWSGYDPDAGRAYLIAKARAEGDELTAHSLAGGFGDYEVYTIRSPEIRRFRSRSGSFLHVTLVTALNELQGTQEAIYLQSAALDSSTYSSYGDRKLIELVRAVRGPLSGLSDLDGKRLLAKREQYSIDGIPQFHTLWTFKPLPEDCQA